RRMPGGNRRSRSGHSRRAGAAGVRKVSARGSGRQPRRRGARAHHLPRHPGRPRRADLGAESRRRGRFVSLRAAHLGAASGVALASARARARGARHVSDPVPILLLIEDEAQMRRFLRASLTHAGYQLIETETAEQGLMQAAAQNPDLVLLDLGLPDLDGLVVTERLRQWAKMPIIVISARGQEHDKIKALDAGADDYLTKPF